MWAQTNSPPNVYTGCLAGGSITNVAIGTSPSKPCGNRATQISWNEQGLQGAQGLQGPQGLQGLVGPAGPDWPPGAGGTSGAAGRPGSDG